MAQDELPLGLPCSGTVGDKPGWMSWDQYDASGGPCECILIQGHKPPCVCLHTKDDT